jgi:2-haloacid dehalogenase
MADRPLYASFDCYGTLIDWEGGVAGFLYDYALRHGDEPAENGDTLRRRWETIQFDIIQGPYQTYKDVLSASLATWARERNLPDRDIITHSLKHLEIPFDVVITAEDCGSYKPSPANFQRLLAELDVPAEDVLHVAFGFKYDIGPAQRLGLRTAWVNRGGQPAPGPERPDFEWRDLWPLAEAAA